MPCLPLAALLFSAVLQTPQNFDFEAKAADARAIPGWSQQNAVPQTGGEGYEAQVDDRVAHGGRQSARLRSLDAAKKWARSCQSTCALANSRR